MVAGSGAEGQQQHRAAQRPPSRAAHQDEGKSDAENNHRVFPASRRQQRGVSKILQLVNAVKSQRSLLIVCRPEPFKFINFPVDTEVKASLSSDGESITLSTNRPVKGIVIDAEGPDVKWSDQGIDLVPDDPQTIQADGLKGREVKLRFLGDGSA